MSQMAGAAEEMPEALILNPYDAEGVADTIRLALDMPVEERRARMHALRERVRQQDIYAWVGACLRDAGTPESILGRLASP